MTDSISIAGALLDAARNRGRLALTESRLALRDVLMIGVLLSMAIVMLMLCGLAVTLAFAAWVWDAELRVLYLVLLGVAYAAVSVAAVQVSRKRLKNWHPLHATAGQLAEDCEALRRHFKGEAPKK